jgi:hypothetical protein
MAEHVRDLAMTAAVLGFFASAWFGWAQEDPPATWRRWLTTGSIVSLVTAAAGGLVAWQNWSTGTVFDRDTSITFGVVVAIEVVLIIAGILILRRRQRKELTAPWVALVVGLHLIPLAPLFGYPLLYLVGALVSIAAVASVPLARRQDVTISAVTGLLAGAVLLAAALISLAAALMG